MRLTEHLSKKIGIVATARKGDDQCASDMCKLALLDLQKRDSNCLDNVDCICVCTQNGDYQLPQTSAVLHQKLNLPIECAAFDISLGCSGYIYALHIMRGFMLENQFRKGLLLQRIHIQQSSAIMIKIQICFLVMLQRLPYLQIIQSTRWVKALSERLAINMLL